MDLGEELICSQWKSDNQRFIHPIFVNICRKPCKNFFILKIKELLPYCGLNGRNRISSGWNRKRSGFQAKYYVGDVPEMYD